MGRRAPAAGQDRAHGRHLGGGYDPNVQRDWKPVIDEARRLVRHYRTVDRINVTLRQISCRLVAAQLIANTDSDYGYLGKLTAEGRRDGTFPPLIDRGRGIITPYSENNPRAALERTLDCYKLDRQLGQPVRIYLGVEKRGQAALMQSWFSPDPP